MKEYSGEDPKLPLDSFIRHVEAQSDYHDWAPRQTARIAKVHLMGDALACVEDTTEPTVKWEELKKVLRQRFCPPGQEPVHRARLSTRMKKAEETLAQYAAELRKLGKLAYPELAAGARNSILADVFIRGQGNEKFKESAYLFEVGTLEKAVRLAQAAETGEQASMLNSNPRKPVVRLLEPASCYDSKDPLEPVIARLSTLEAKLGRDKSPSRGSRPLNRPPRSPTPIPGAGRARSLSRERNPDELQCFKCQGLGHMARDCPSPYNYEWTEDGHPHRIGYKPYRESKRAESKERGDPKGQGGPMKLPMAPPKIA
jgi:hypothetical protein